MGPCRERIGVLKQTFFKTIISQSIIIILSETTFPLAGMWIKEADYREQPDIHYKHKMMLFLRGSSLTNTELVYSTFPYYNFLLQNNLRIPTIKVYE